MQCLPPLTRSGLTSPTSGLRARNHADAMHDATLAEVFAETATDGAVAGFVCAHLHGATKPVLWVQDRVSRKEAGRPYLAGLPKGLEVIHVDANRPRDVLWAMEEGLRCTGLSAVLGEIWGDPAVLDFTATKRLALRAERSGVPVWLLRGSAARPLSAARQRWCEALTLLGRVFHVLGNHRNHFKHDRSADKRRYVVWQILGGHHADDIATHDVHPSDRVQQFDRFVDVETHLARFDV